MKEGMETLFTCGMVLLMMVLTSGTFWIIAALFYLFK